MWVCCSNRHTQKKIGRFSRGQWIVQTQNINWTKQPHRSTPFNTENVSIKYIIICCCCWCFHSNLLLLIFSDHWLEFICANFFFSHWPPQIWTVPICFRHTLSVLIAKSERSEVWMNLKLFWNTTEKLPRICPIRSFYKFIILLFFSRIISLHNGHTLVEYARESSIESFPLCKRCFTLNFNAFRMSVKESGNIKL